MTERRLGSGGNSSVALYHRKTNAEPEDPEIAALPVKSRARVKQMLAQLQKRTDPAQLEQMSGMMEAMMSQVPEEDRPGMEYIIKKMRERIEELLDDADS